jgi:hypothetical protein
MHENWETSGAPRPEREGGRSWKVPSHKADAHALEESDRAIVTMNQRNEEEQSPAESGEKRAPGQGEHRLIQHLPDTVRGNRVCQGLRGVRVATLLVIHPRWEPYAGKPLVRFCAGAISDGRPYLNTWLGSAGGRVASRRTALLDRPKAIPTASYLSPKEASHESA